jgi:hypothetical protein
MSSKDLIISEIVHQVVEARNARKDEKHYWVEYDFNSIQSIHGINSDVELSFGFKMWDDAPNDFNVVLKINHNVMYDNEDCEAILLYHHVIGRQKKFDRETISSILDKLKEILSSLQFSIRNGIFLSKPSTIEAQIEFLQDIKFINFGEECSICKEHIINTKTECGHYLCVPCFQQIQLVEYDKRPCPFCRDHITYTKS